MSTLSTPIGGDRWWDSPTAWFAALERARLTGDRPLEARARHELQRLGVSVAFVPKPQAQREDHHA